MLFMRVFIQILAHKDKVYFAPYIRNIKVHNSYYVRLFTKFSTEVERRFSPAQNI